MGGREGKKRGKVEETSERKEREMEGGREINSHHQPTHIQYTQLVTTTRSYIWTEDITNTQLGLSQQY